MKIKSEILDYMYNGGGEIMLTETGNTLALQTQILG